MVAEPVFNKMFVLWIVLELTQVSYMAKMVQVFIVGNRSYSAYRIKHGVSF